MNAQQLKDHPINLACRRHLLALGDSPVRGQEVLDLLHSLAADEDHLNPEQREELQDVLVGVSAAAILADLDGNLEVEEIEAAKTPMLAADLIRTSLSMMG